MSEDSNGLGVVLLLIVVFWLLRRGTVSVRRRLRKYSPKNYSPRNYSPTKYESKQKPLRGSELFDSSPSRKYSPKKYQIEQKPLMFASETGNEKTATFLSVSCQEVRAQSRSISTETQRVKIHGPCYVVDGDTLNIGDLSIRLFGIDAPELDHPYGNNAKWALINLCRGHIIQAVIEQGDLTHDRTVATCYLPDGRDLSAEMVKLGMAVDWPKYSGGRYRSFELPNIRKKLWRCDARQKGRMLPSSFTN